MNSSASLHLGPAAIFHGIDNTDTEPPATLATARCSRGVGSVILARPLTTLDTRTPMTGGRYMWSVWGTQPAGTRHDGQIRTPWHGMVGIRAKRRTGGWHGFRQRRFHRCYYPPLGSTPLGSRMSTDIGLRGD
jgi:hypothetical protein